MMSDVKNLYILKPDVIIDEYKDIRIVRPSPGSSFIQEIPNAVFDKLFEPLDVESLTTQLEDILEKFWQDEDQDLDDSVAEVLSLLGMKGKE